MTPSAQRYDTAGLGLIAILAPACLVTFAELFPGVCVVENDGNDIFRV
jgi:hypothetical protein